MNVNGFRSRFRILGTVNHSSALFLTALLAAAVLPGSSGALAATPKQLWAAGTGIAGQEAAVDSGFHVPSLDGQDASGDLVFLKHDAVPPDAVRLAQGVHEFWAIDNDRRGRNRAAPKMKIYTAPKVKTYQAPQPFFTFSKKPPKPGQSNKIFSFGGASNGYVVYGSDGRSYIVYPDGTRRDRRSRSGKIVRPTESQYSGYRTMCVRTCDGFYYPVSNATSQGRLRRDKNTCQSSCGVPTKLYYYSNNGGTIEDMIDLRGRKYSAMKNAFRYRKELVANCRCKAQPWAQSEIIRHEQYAMDEADRGIRRVRLVRVSENTPTSSDKKLRNRVEETGEKIADHDEPTTVRAAKIAAKIEAGETWEPPESDTVYSLRQQKLRSRQRYRMSARRMRQWWRSSRY